jgi:hypothetical protein
MTIHAKPGKLHWNYFLALERDLDDQQLPAVTMRVR